MAYHTTQGEHANSFETFWMAAKDWPDNPDTTGRGGPIEPDMRNVEDGWFWWFCEPGCLPEGDAIPNGPFKTEAEAIADCNEYCNS